MHQNAAPVTTAVTMSTPSWLCPNCGERYSIQRNNNTCRHCPGVILVEVARPESIANALASADLQGSLERQRDRYFLVGAALVSSVVYALMWIAGHSDFLSLICAPLAGAGIGHAISLSKQQRHPLRVWVQLVPALLLGIGITTGYGLMAMGVAIDPLTHTILGDESKKSTRAREDWASMLSTQITPLKACFSPSNLKTFAIARKANTSAWAYKPSPTFSAEEQDCVITVVKGLPTPPLNYYNKVMCQFIAKGDQLMGPIVDNHQGCAWRMETTPRSP